MSRRPRTDLATALPLAGAAIVVTRPSGTATSIRRRVRALGGTFIGLPGIAVARTEDAAAARRALRAAQSAALVLFTSPAAVRFAFALLPRLRFHRATVIGAPGPGSVRALRRHGVADAVYPHTRRDSEGLLALPVLHALRGKQVALIGAPGGRDLLGRELRRRGACVTFIAVYVRALPRLDSRHRRALELAPTPLISLISSVDALTNLHAVLPTPLFERLLRNDCVVSSARIADAARRLGCARVHLAASADPADLLARARTVVALHRL